MALHPLSCNDRDTVDRAGRIFRCRAREVRDEAGQRSSGFTLTLLWASCLEAAATCAELLLAEDADARNAQKAGR